MEAGTTRKTPTTKCSDTGLISAIEAAIVERQPRRAGQETLFLCPAHDDHHPSARWNHEKQCWFCDACGAKGGALDLAKQLGLAIPTRKNASGKDKRRYAGHAADDGRIVAYHVRIGDGVGKRVWWEQPDGINGLGGFQLTNLSLHGAEELAADVSLVVVTEGETARDALSARGVSSVGTMTGASAIPCDVALAALLRHATVLLWADNDEPGAKHMDAIAERLQALGHQDVRRIIWPDAPAKGDAADFAGNDDELSALLASAVSSELSPTVDLAALLDAITTTLARYVVLTASQRDAIALWTAHGHVFAAADSTPYLAIYSPDKRCGKTRLLEVLEGIVARPWLTGRVSAAALVRKVDADSPTLLLDESDAAFNGDREYAEVLRGVLNSGHRRGGCVSVCVGQNSNIVVKDFSAFCPKAIAGIGKLPDTVADRSIPITMRRKGKGESVERFRYRTVQGVTASLRAQLETWALTAAAVLTASEPVLPFELNDRASDGWEPLLAIADAAGGNWPTRARKAALELSCDAEVEDESFGVRMLSDVRNVFADLGDDACVVASATLVGRLTAIGEAPWSNWNHGRGLDERSLATLLRPYGIKPTKKRTSATMTVRGYEARDFEDAWGRYLSPLHSPTQEPEQVEHPEQWASSDVGDVPGATDIEAERWTEAKLSVDSQLAFVPPVPPVPTPREVEALAPDVDDPEPTEVLATEPPTECYVCAGEVTYVGENGTGFCERHLPVAQRHGDAEAPPLAVSIQTPEQEHPWPRANSSSNCDQPVGSYTDLRNKIGPSGGGQEACCEKPRQVEARR